VLISEVNQRVRKWLDLNQKFVPDLKSGKRWLEGFGWDQNMLPEKKYPTAVSPFLTFTIDIQKDLEIPELEGVHIKFYRNDGHCAWVSSSSHRMQS
jgi:hypothetical protein